MYGRCLSGLTALLLVVSACGGENEASFEAVTTTVAEETTTSTTAESTASTTAAAPTTTTTVAFDPVQEPCELLDTATLKAAGVELDPEPRIESVTAADDPSVSESLGRQGLVAFGSCDVAYPVTLIVWEAEGPKGAAAHLQSTLTDAQRDGNASRTDLPADLAEEGASVVDSELDNSTVQWRSDRYHVVINLLTFADLGLSVDEVRSVHERLVEFGQRRLDPSSAHGGRVGG